MTQLSILAVLLASVALAHWLGTTRVGRPLGGAILVILLVATLANFGVIPTASDAPPLYGQLLSVGAPVSIFLLLLNVRLGALRHAGLPMIGLFLLGSIGTMLGVYTAGILTDSEQWLGQWNGPVAGMFSATYIGGGANFNALALHFDFFSTGNLFVAATVADHIFTVVWITLLLALPRLVQRWLPDRSGQAASDQDVCEDDAESKPSLFDLATLLALAFGAHAISVVVAVWLAAYGVAIPTILILTTLALILAQIPAIHRLKGTNMLGMYGAYLFLGVLGAYCELSALAELGGMALKILLFVGLAVSIHGAILISGGLWMRQSPAAIAVASTANIGGSTVVLPMVQTFKRMDLLLPGILVGSLGNAIGTYLGFFMVRLVGG
ncbi:MAG: membrane protein [Lysobacteraceae bacterium]|nr:MAG: membrane protein [Xanthomonadaceae bacterium]